MGLKQILLGVLAALAGGLTAAHAESVYWSDDFETNSTARWQTNSSWKVSAPTTGPAVNTNGYRTHSGARCANINAHGVDTRLICTNYGGATNLLIPDSDATPRLRFWQWFDIANGFFYVEANDGTGWTQISPIYNAADYKNSGGVWSQTSLDLSAYAGESIQIAFHYTFGSLNQGGTGWYVDDVSVVTDTQLSSNPENFESGATDWAVDGGTWQIGTPASSTGGAHNGTNCAATSLTGTTPYNANSRLLMPPVKLPVGPSTLQFADYMRINNGFALVELQSGTNWVPLSSTNRNIVDTNWVLNAYDLSAYSNQTVQLAFHFTSGGINSSIGWYIDDVSIATPSTLTIPTNRTISFGDTFTDNAVATNTFQTTIGYTFALATKSTNGFLTTNGVFTWTNPTPTLGTNWINVKVTDNNLVPYRLTNAFAVLVLPTAPTLTVPTNRTIAFGTTFSDTARATNPVEPNATYTYKLTATSTNGYLSANGAYFWTNKTPSFGSTVVGIQAIDNNLYPYPVTNSFTVTVVPTFGFTSTNLLGSATNFQFSLASQPNVTFRIQASTNLVNWSTLYTTNTGSNGLLQVTDPSGLPQRFYRVIYP